MSPSCAASSAKAPVLITLLAVAVAEGIRVQHRGRFHTGFGLHREGCFHAGANGSYQEPQSSPGPEEFLEIMANPDFERQAKHVAEQMEAMMSDPSFQLKAQDV